MSKIVVSCPICKTSADCNTDKKQCFCRNTDCVHNSTSINVIELSSRGIGFELLLSNFFPHDFKLSGVKCSSLEGFLRSLVEPDLKVQKQICKLSGANAYKIREGLRDWRPEQILYWRKKKIKREGYEYAALITKAFDSIFKSNSLFRKTLLSTKGSVLVHPIGCIDKKESLLTVQEYLYQLNRLRDKSVKRRGVFRLFHS